jgi:hypothetical protein
MLVIEAALLEHLEVRVIERQRAGGRDEAAHVPVRDQPELHRGPP